MNPLHNIETSVSKRKSTRTQTSKVSDEERVTISVGRKAYDALVQHAKQLTKENPDTQKPFTIEEILDEEILLLFSDDWKQKK